MESMMAPAIEGSVAAGPLQRGMMRPPIGERSIHMARRSRTPYDSARMRAWEDVWESANFRHLKLPVVPLWDGDDDAAWVITGCEFCQSG
jgi:hypothetical protein